MPDFIDSLFPDRKYRVPRLWSNAKLRKFAPLFTGDIVNVSAWTDSDKEGKKYRHYFCNASSYHLTNYLPETCGLQGYPNEIFLDLTEKLAPEHERSFDVVFNHTTLEHIFEVQTAFENLCRISRDIVILVVPFLQPMHSSYGDYWRFTPQTIKRLFAKHGYNILHLSANDHKHTSVYLFCIASRQPEKWKNKIPYNFDYTCRPSCFSSKNSMTGCRAVTNPLGYSILNFYNRASSAIKHTLKQRFNQK
jgi:hypothetical protein